MSVIIRLQNLPWSAQAFDIRQYFHGLSIPEGGVHIVGGELGDAFIAFSTDEDARQAMLTDGGKIKEVKIKLYLSSRSEMQKVIETARTQSLQPYLQQIQATQIPAATVQPQAAVQPQPTITPQAASIQPQVAAIHPQVATIQPQPATITTQVPISVTQIQSAATQIQPAITQIPPTPTQTAPAMPSLTQIPIPVAEQPTDAQDTPLPPLPPSGTPASTADGPPESASSTVESAKKDQDAESTTSKDNKRSRKGRSRSRSKSRSKNRSNSRSKSRSKSRDRSRSRDRSYRSRYKDRRRRDRSRSRDRRSRRRRDRSRSRDRSRRYSRERKRDSDKNDANSVEGSSNAKDFGKITPVAENKPAIPQMPAPTPGKPGFSSSGWVPVGSADKSGPMLQKPIGFSISKQPIVPGPPHQNQMPQNNIQPQISQASVIPPTAQMNINAHVVRPNMHPQMPPLPPQTQLPPPQIPGNTAMQPNSTPQMMLPHPPPFPVMPMDPLGFPKTNEQNNMPFMPVGFPQPPQPNMAPPQQNAFLAQNQPQLPRPMNPNQFPGWGPMRPPMDPSMFNPPGMFNVMQQAPGNMNVAMFNRPPFVPPVNQQPYAHPDPRLQNAANSQPRPDQNINNNPALQNLSKPPGEYDISKNKVFNLCVEIRNMSISTTSGDIRRFFQGLHIPTDGIKIITDKKGNKIGMAYVQFEKSYFKDMALKRNGQMLANSNVEILPIDDAIFDKATDFSGQSSHSEGNYYQKPPFKKDYQQDSYNNFNEEDDNGEIFTDLVVHEAPLNSRDKDIYNLFKGFKITDAFVLSGPKKCTGFVRFRAAEEARRALAVSSRLSIGYTPVKVAICYENEFAEARDRKNMEENDEMMDTKDSIYDHDTRESKKYSSQNYAKERSDPRFNSAGRRGPPKALLPTPSSRSFDPRTPHGNKSNPNFHSRFDKREPVKYSRESRENLSDKQYSNEESSSRSRLSSEKSRFQQTPSHPRESYHQKASSQGELRKRPHNETPELAGVDLPPSKIASSSDQKAKQPSDQQKTPQPEAEKMMEVTVMTAVDDSLSTNIEKPPTEVTSATTPNTNSEKEENGPSLHQNTPAQKASNVVEQPPHVAVNTDCLILQGLPYTATDRDILDFFSDVGLAPTKIHIMLDRTGQPAGDAFCEFNTSEEVAKALAKNKHIVGRSSVSVRPIPREELMSALGAVDTLGPEIPYSEEGEHYQPPPMGGHRPAPRFPRMPSHPPYPPQFPPRGRGRGAFRGGIGRHHPPPQETEMTSKNVKAFGKPGCVVALENVPFRAEVDDIIEFFKDFFVPRDNVIRRFDENGRATGDARVCLSSPIEAQRALRLLNERRLFNRDIYLSLVP